MEEFKPDENIKNPDISKELGLELNSEDESLIADVTILRKTLAGLIGGGNDAIKEIADEIKKKFPDDYQYYGIYHIAIGSTPDKNFTKGINLPGAEKNYVPNLFFEKINKINKI